MDILKLWGKREEGSSVFQSLLLSFFILMGFGMTLLTPGRLRKGKVNPDLY